MSTGRSFLLAFYIAVVYCFLCCACASASKSDTVHRCGKPVHKPLTKTGDKLGKVKTSKSHSWPWMAHLTVQLKMPCSKDSKDCFVPTNTGDCSASLIDSKWLLTAAHCLSPKGRKMDVKASSGRLGLHTIGDANVETVSFANIFIHPNFSHNSHTFFRPNDFALVELEKEVEYNDNVLPVCLSKNDDLTTVDRESYVIGWGHIDFKNPTSPLKQGMVPIAECNDITFYDEYDEEDPHQHKSNICAGHGYYSRKSCWVEIGGAPLMTKARSAKNPEQNTWYQTGVVSYGYDECGHDFPIPAFYGKVSYACDWIAKVTGKNLCSEGKPEVTPKNKPKMPPAPIEPEVPWKTKPQVKPIMRDSRICDVLKMNSTSENEQEVQDNAQQAIAVNVRFSCGPKADIVIAGKVREGDHSVRYNHLILTEFHLDFQCNCKDSILKNGKPCQFEATNPIFKHHPVFKSEKPMLGFVGFRKFEARDGVLEIIDKIKCVNFD